MEGADKKQSHRAVLLESDPEGGVSAAVFFLLPVTVAEVSSALASVIVREDACWVELTLESGIELEGCFSVRVHIAGAWVAVEDSRTAPVSGNSSGVSFVDKFFGWLAIVLVLTP